MQEYSFDLSGGLKNGLVPDPLMPNASDYALLMRNLRPEEEWAGSAEILTDPGANAVSWPFPKIVRDDKVTLKLDSTSVYTLASDWTATAQTVKQSSSQSTTKSLTGGIKWDFCAFEDQAWFATNTVDMIFKLSTYTPVLFADGITCSTLCRNGDTLFLSGLAGSWFSGTRFSALLNIWRVRNNVFMSDKTAWDTTWMMYAKKCDVDNPFFYAMLALGVFGNTLYDKFEGEIHAAIKNGDIGFVSTRSLGTPRASLGLGDGVRIYSSSGITTLSPSENGYTASYDNGNGIMGFALSGDLTEHAWIDPIGRLNSTRHQFPGNAFRWIFQTWTAPVMSFDPMRNEHWISDGTNTYILTNEGKLGGPFLKCPTGLFRNDNQLIAAHTNRSTSTLTAEYQSFTHNMNYRGSKRLQVIESVYNGFTSPVCNTSARTGDGGSYTTMGDKPFNSYGVAWPVRSGNDFKITVKGSVSGSARYGINSIIARYQAEDSRFRRGTVAPPEGA